MKCIKSYKNWYIDEWIKIRTILIRKTDRKWDHMIRQKSYYLSFLGIEFSTVLFWGRLGSGVATGFRALGSSSNITSRITEDSSYCSAYCLFGYFFGYCACLGWDLAIYLGCVSYCLGDCFTGYLGCDLGGLDCCYFDLLILAWEGLFL